MSFMLAFFQIHVQPYNEFLKIINAKALLLAFLQNAGS